MFRARERSAAGDKAPEKTKILRGILSENVNGDMGHEDECSRQLSMLVVDGMR